MNDAIYRQSRYFQNDLERIADRERLAKEAREAERKNRENQEKHNQNHNEKAA